MTTPEPATALIRAVGVVVPARDEQSRVGECLRALRAALDEIPVDEARKYVMALAEHADSELARLEELRDAPIWGSSGADFYARAALEFGLRNAVMEAEWARDLLAGIDRDGASGSPDHK